MVLEKIMECLRTRMNLELVTNATRAKKLIAKPTIRHWDIISDNLVPVRKQKPKIIVDRPIYLGFCILDLSKITMYRFHYEEILYKYGSRAKLAYRLIYLSYSDTYAMQRHGGQLGGVLYVRLSSHSPPPLKNECQGPR